MDRHPKLDAMRIYITYLLLALFSVIAFGSCTNDEGGEDLDVLTPAEKQEQVHPEHAK